MSALSPIPSREMSVHQLHPQGIPMQWQQQLKRATTEREVVMVTRDFIATFSPAELAVLPQELRPRKIVDAQDITTYGFDLVRAECEASDAKAALHRLGQFFSAASIRLSEIMAGQQTEDQRSA